MIILILKTKNLCSTKYEDCTNGLGSNVAFCVQNWPELQIGVAICLLTLPKVPFLVFS